MLLIKGGRVIDPKTGMDQVQDIVIQDGIIKTIGPVSYTHLRSKAIIWPELLWNAMERLFQRLLMKIR